MAKKDHGFLQGRFFARMIFCKVGFLQDRFFARTIFCKVGFCTHDVLQGRLFAVTSYCRDTVAVCIYVASLRRTALSVVGCQYGLAHALLTPPPRNVFFLTTLTQ